MKNQNHRFRWRITRQCPFPHIFHRYPSILILSSPYVFQINVLKEILYKLKFQKFFEKFLGFKKFIFLGMFSWMDFHLLESIQTFSTLFFMSFSKFYQNSNSSRKSFTNGNFNIFWNFLGLKKFIFLGMVSLVDSHPLKSIQTFSTLFFLWKPWIFMKKFCENFQKLPFLSSFPQFKLIIFGFFGIHLFSNFSHQTSHFSLVSFLKSILFLRKCFIIWIKNYHLAWDFVMKIWKRSPKLRVEWLFEVQLKISQHWRGLQVRSTRRWKALTSYFLILKKFWS